jgi:hypothetical protein
MVVALLVSGAIYTALSYVETVAYPTPQALAAASANGVPLAEVASAYLTGGFGTVITVAAVISGFGAQLATINGATRLLFASGLGPAALGRVHTKYRSVRPLDACHHRRRACLDSAPTARQPAAGHVRPGPAAHGRGRGYRIPDQDDRVPAAGPDRPPGCTCWRRPRPSRPGSASPPHSG